MLGEARDDQYYKDNWDIPEQYAHAGGALTNMNAKETLAYHDGLVGEALFWQQKYDLMKQYYQKSIEEDPTRLFSPVNLAWFYLGAPGHLSNPKLAVEYYGMSAHIFPNKFTYHYLACAYAFADDFNRASIFMGKGRGIDYPFDDDDFEKDSKAVANDHICEIDRNTFGKDHNLFRPHEVYTSGSTGLPTRQP
jgi:tetratricopeptide (TPR) repeat protein